MGRHPLARSESARADYGEYYGTPDYPHDCACGWLGIPFRRFSPAELDSLLSLQAAEQRHQTSEYFRQQGYHWTGAGWEK